MKTPEEIAAQISDVCGKWDDITCNAAQELKNEIARAIRAEREYMACALEALRKLNQTNTIDYFWTEWKKKHPYPDYGRCDAFRDGFEIGFDDALRGSKR